MRPHELGIKLPACRHWPKRLMALNAARATILGSRLAPDDRQIAPSPPQASPVRPPPPACSRRQTNGHLDAASYAGIFASPRIPDSRSAAEVGEQRLEERRAHRRHVGVGGDQPSRRVRPCEGGWREVGRGPLVHFFLHFTLYPQRRLEAPPRARVQLSRSWRQRQPKPVQHPRLPHARARAVIA